MMSQVMLPSSGGTRDNWGLVLHCWDKSGPIWDRDTDTKSVTGTSRDSQFVSGLLATPTILIFASVLNLRLGINKEGSSEHLHKTIR